MTDINKEALVNLYRHMATSHIEEKIASGRLSNMMLSIARQELQAREKAANEAARSITSERYTPAVNVVLIFTQALVVSLVVLLLHYQYAAIIITVEVTVVASVVAKIFPTFGKVMGTILVALPFVVIAVLWYQGELAWGAFGSGYGYIFRIFTYGFLFISSMISLSIGYSMLDAARFIGSWGEFFGRLEARQKKAVQSVTDRDANR